MSYTPKDDNQLLQLVKNIQITKIGEVHGAIYRRISSWGFVDVGDNIRITGADQPLFSHYGQMAIYCATLYRFINKLPQENTLFEKVTTSVKEMEESHEPFGFPYDHPDFPKQGDPIIPGLLSILNGQIQLQASDVINLREWLIIPGRLLFIKFYRNFSNKLKDMINQEFSNRQIGNNDNLSVDIAKEILQDAFSTEKHWYPLATNLALSLVMRTPTSLKSLRLDFDLGPYICDLFTQHSFCSDVFSKINLLLMLTMNLLLLVVLLLVVTGLFPEVNAQSRANKELQISIKQDKPPIYGFYSDDSSINMKIIIENNLQKDALLTIQGETSLLSSPSIKKGLQSFGNISIPSKSNEILDYFVSLPDGHWSLTVIAKNQTGENEYKVVEPFTVYPISTKYQFWVNVISIVGIIGLIVTISGFFIQYKNMRLAINEIKLQRRPWISITDKGFEVDPDTNKPGLYLKNYGSLATTSLRVLFLEKNKEPVKKEDLINESRNPDSNKWKKEFFINIGPDEVKLYEFAPLHPLQIQSSYIVENYFGFLVKYDWYNKEKYYDNQHEPGILVVIFKYQKGEISIVEQYNM